ncbi:MAG: 7TM diverse intracellular signaling domain-containing protein [Vicingaceae bacterium]|nr:7TM diverse intracellular signaling domain-containing protein [Vicingaceae bacterium]
MTVYNSTNDQDLILKLGAPMIDNIEFYYPNHLNEYHSIITGESETFKSRKYQDPNFLFDLTLPNKTQKTYFLKISSTEDIVLPITIGTKDVIFKKIKTIDIISGIYIGIMLVMILYNLFIYFSVRDKSYLYYVFYVLIVLLVQTGFQGYFFQYLWPNSPSFSQYSVFLFSSLSGIAGMAFMNVFLKVKYFYKKLYFITILISLLYLIPIIIPLFGFSHLGWKALNIIAGIVSFYMLFLTIKIVRKGYQPAKYFLAAWLIFLLGVIGFVLKNTGILPFNIVTRYTMHIGSALETILLSFALAARINIYKKEKEESQQKTVEVLNENQKIIREQNIVLEQKVKKRTEELNDTLNNLKQAQSQLVDSEKMASLGQLTAGIAHEINNPINFVSSNIIPLRQDIGDLNTILNKYAELENSNNISEKLKEIEALKKELDYDYLKTELSEIINGIEDGAKRTTEIVSGLRNFSRLDEGELNIANINTGIESTLLIVKSKLNNIKVVLELGNIPNYECNPGKINQAILNLIDNAIYAIEKNKDTRDGLIKIKTFNTSKSIIISVSDNGTGIPNGNLSKLFDPFYTTKDVGEGTGLGLSIVRGVVDSHDGIINIESAENKGTEIVIELPIKK